MKQLNIRKRNITDSFGQVLIICLLTAVCNQILHAQDLLLESSSSREWPYDGLFEVEGEIWASRLPYYSIGDTVLHHKMYKVDEDNVALDSMEIYKSSHVYSYIGKQSNNHFIFAGFDEVNLSSSGVYVEILLFDLHFELLDSKRIRLVDNLYTGLIDLNFIDNTFVSLDIDFMFSVNGGQFTVLKKLMEFEIENDSLNLTYDELGTSWNSSIIIDSIKVSDSNRGFTLTNLRNNSSITLDIPQGLSLSINSRYEYVNSNLLLCAGITRSRPTVLQDEQQPYLFKILLSTNELIYYESNGKEKSAIAARDPLVVHDQFAYFTSFSGTLSDFKIQDTNSIFIEKINLESMELCKEIVITPANAFLTPITTSIADEYLYLSCTEGFVQDYGDHYLYRVPLSLLEECTSDVQELNFSFDKLTIFPNPCQDFITFNGELEFEEILFYDVNGKLVLRISDIGHQTDISALKPGNYQCIARRGLKYHSANLIKM